MPFVQHRDRVPLVRHCYRGRVPHECAILCCVTCHSMCALACVTRVALHHTMGQVRVPEFPGAAVWCNRHLRGVASWVWHHVPALAIDTLGLIATVSRGVSTSEAHPSDLGDRGLQESFLEWWGWDSSYLGREWFRRLRLWWHHMQRCHT